MNKNCFRVHLIHFRRGDLDRLDLSFVHRAMFSPTTAGPCP